MRKIPEVRVPAHISDEDLEKYKIGGIAGRVCVCGCGRRILDKHGLPTFDRFFFNKECRRKDKAGRRAELDAERKIELARREAKARVAAEKHLLRKMLEASGLPHRLRKHLRARFRGVTPLTAEAVSAAIEAVRPARKEQSR